MFVLRNPKQGEGIGLFAVKQLKFMLNFALSFYDNLYTCTLCVLVSRQALFSAVSRFMFK